MDNLTCACWTDAEKHGRTLTDIQTERWTDDGSEKQEDRLTGEDNRVLPKRCTCLASVSQRQFTALLTYTMSVFTVCVLEHYHLISLQMEYSCLLILTSFADTPAHTDTHARTNRFILIQYISPLFLLVLIEEAGTAGCANYFLIRESLSGNLPVIKMSYLQLSHSCKKHMTSDTTGFPNWEFIGELWKLVYKDKNSQLEEKRSVLCCLSHRIVR